MNANMKSKIVRILIVSCVAMSMLAGGCSGKETNRTEAESSAALATGNDTASEEPAQRDIFAMDTYMTVQAYGEHGEEAVEQAEKEIERLDALLSTGSEESEIGIINANGGGELSEDGNYLIQRALELNKETGGAFDIAIYPVMEAWGFPTQEFKVPTDEEIQSLLPLTDCSKIDYDKKNGKISFDESGMKIDLGGIAKGYTSSQIMKIYKDLGVTSGLVNLGGNVQVLSTKPDGSDWKVAVQSPYDESDYLGVLAIQDQAVITSGGYERYFEQDGKTYHHIIDPTTGYPAEKGLISVTIVSEDGTLADGLSTSLFIMGKDKAIEFWKKHSDEFDTILMTDDDKLYVTAGISDAFTAEDDYEVEIVNK